jgi:endonuclease VIII-like 1
MPELAEVKIMSEFINQKSRGVVFRAINVSEHVVKRMPLEHSEAWSNFYITALSRGKELRITLTDTLSYYEQNISFTMGMSGNWVWIPDGDFFPKHTHLIFRSEIGCLALVDMRRFAKWKWTDRWNYNRGPCPVAESESFPHYLRKHSSKKVFDKPIYRLMMDQKYFNGIGNYLRAEILYRAEIDPFTPAREAIEDKEFIKLCTQVPQEAYEIGGGAFKDWDNPYEKKVDIGKWMKCYGKKEKFVDSTGRAFWYDPKFVSEENKHKLQEMVEK